MNPQILSAVAFALIIAPPALGDDLAAKVLRVFESTCGAPSKPDSLDAMDALATAQGLSSLHGHPSRFDESFVWSFGEADPSNLELLVGVSQPHEKDRVFSCSVEADGGDPQILIDGLKSFARLGEPERRESVSPNRPGVTFILLNWNVAAFPLWARYRVAFTSEAPASLVNVNLSKGLPTAPP